MPVDKKPGHNGAGRVGQLQRRYCLGRSIRMASRVRMASIVGRACARRLTDITPARLRPKQSRAHLQHPLSSFAAPGASPEALQAGMVA